MDRQLRSPALIAAATLLALFAFGCSPKIGDDCNSSTDCSLRGDRLCDSTQPGGYCTVFNCEPDGCPEEAQCVAFQASLDPVCVDPQQYPRFRRSFCMKRCENDGDCRDGYDCVNMAGANAWAAIVVDNDPEGTKVCVSPQFSVSDPSGVADLCGTYDGGFPDVEYYVPDAISTQDASDGAQDAADEAQDDASGQLDSSDDASQD